MSVRCIDRVLELSAHAGTELLMLVVLADYSDDDGNSYPSVASLARKCRMTPRNANYILQALQASGELRVSKNQGPKGTNRYRIMIERLGAQGPAATLKPTSPLKSASPLKVTSPPEAAFSLKPTSATPEAGFPKPLKPTSDEPSLNRQEPSRKKRARAKPAETTIPDDFAITDSVRSWAEQQGWAEYLPAHLDQFVGYAKAKAKTYADWDQAFMNAIRGDWGDVRKRALQGVQRGGSALRADEQFRGAI